ncbi:hypothetical protein K8P10_002406 [Leucobacter sp. Psy1]|uniref:apolipoprotein A1/A4/E family protein n=1 Tax=Leucobacter sp. Psy1 TaxID=2875729 RepID=UPI001CD6FD49|nr:apolipoprotein A1/A4/E family protein [Leucobacter sp. Psy1]UBH06895.1 hypothetical protein K8P10_002406 [Leucobacter sp. Psy1]
MSVDAATMIVSAGGLLVTLGAALIAGFAWVIKRIDGVEYRLTGRIDDVEQKLTDRLDSVDQKLTDRLDSVDQKLTDRIDSVDQKLTDRIDGISGELTEVRITVARLEEGPPRHLILSR